MCDNVSLMLYCCSVSVAQGLIPAVRTSTSRSVLANAKAQLLMALQDEDVGAVLGKKGQTLTQIQQVGQGECTLCASTGPLVMTVAC